MADQKKPEAESKPNEPKSEAKKTEEAPRKNPKENTVLRPLLESMEPKKK